MREVGVDGSLVNLVAKILLCSHDKRNVSDLDLDQLRSKLNRVIAFLSNLFKDYLEVLVIDGVSLLAPCLDRLQ